MKLLKGLGKRCFHPKRFTIQAEFGLEELYERNSAGSREFLENINDVEVSLSFTLVLWTRKNYLSEKGPKEFLFTVQKTEKL